MNRKHNKETIKHFGPASALVTGSGIKGFGYQKKTKLWKIENGAGKEKIKKKGIINIICPPIRQKYVKAEKGKII